MVQFDQRWKDWLERNLQRGVAEKKLAARMVFRGFSEQFADEQIRYFSSQSRQGLSTPSQPGSSEPPKHGQDRLVHYVEVLNFLSRDEVLKIRTSIDGAERQAGRIGNSAVDPSIRNNEILWIDLEAIDSNIYSRFTKTILDINRRKFQFNITQHVCKFQVSWYGCGSHYDFHLDLGSGNSRFRKLTSVIQLSDKDEYSGGDLELKFGGAGKSASKEIGSLFIFPSFLLHRVTPVQNGIRLSLVNWSLGPQFC